ncbi:MAG: ATP-dependent DNA helicase RecG [Coriobacteriales bacterium]|jgi:ATP-dependent DNA helicase RecG|nr:ATP-dependent DNA helicase RecG [Coriobacteriales bacterium]
MDRIEQTDFLHTPVTGLRFAQGARLRGLARLGIETIRDLLFHFPIRYNDFSQVVAIRDLTIGEKLSVMGTVDEIKIKRPRPRLMIVEASILDGSGVLIASWFNQPWMARTLKTGSKLLLLGKVEHGYGHWRMASPLVTTIPTDQKVGGILPVYRANADISSAWIARIIREALDRLPALLDPLPATLRVRGNFRSRQTALRALHLPLDEDERRQAHRRLAFEEIFELQLFMMLRRNRATSTVQPIKHLTAGAARQALTASLPFRLTTDQSCAVAEILADMADARCMNRLLLGDVGTGKTIVAAHALAAAHDSGTQAAMMAPTEVLAEQYALKLGPLFDRLGIPWALLTSSTPAAVRRDLREGLANGHISVLFGTHALIEPDVLFQRLSLVVIDEQHRFGVAQRAALCEKGSGCDLLTMTATPIPRSLALTIYGDMECSYIRERPITATKSKTRVIARSGVHLAYEAIRCALDRGEQAYIICPLISHEQADDARREGDAPDDDETDSPALLTEFSDEVDEGALKAVEQEVAYLRAKVFPERRIGLMTSHLKPVEKRAVMDAFRAGELDILVSTTVVEVGVDVPNATVMVIQDADRFGLSQLHQLRGRVGRGERDAEIFLVAGALSDEARERLGAMERTNDGFELAEYDLKLRREGDILGSRQHGLGQLKLVNVVRDADLIKVAHQQAHELLARDPLLTKPEHRLLARELEQAFPDPEDTL